MSIVSNTTPLNYLVLIEAVGILPQLYGRVLIPQQVLSELKHSGTPDIVRTWASNPPDWLEIREVNVHEDPFLGRMDVGESAAIILAEQVAADLILMDERDGRREALRRGLSITGTLGVLERAAEADLIDFKNAAERLQKTQFRITEQLMRPFLQRDAKRRTRSDA